MVTTSGKPPYLDAGRPLEARAQDLASRLTLEEKVALMAGAAPFTLEGVARLGVPRINVTDGPGAPGGTRVGMSDACGWPSSVPINCGTAEGSSVRVPSDLPEPSPDGLIAMLAPN